MHEKQSELRFKKFSKWISRKKNTWNGKHPSNMAVRLTASLPLKNRLKPPKRNFIFQPVLFTGYVSLRELLVWERVSHITFIENMTQHWGRIKPSPGLGNTAGAGSPKQNTNTHIANLASTILSTKCHLFLSKRFPHFLVNKNNSSSVFSHLDWNWCFCMFC